MQKTRYYYCRKCRKRFYIENEGMTDIYTDSGFVNLCGKHYKEYEAIEKRYDKLYADLQPMYSIDIPKAEKKERRLIDKFFKEVDNWLKAKR